MRHLIPDLTPNQAYGIQFRLNNGSAVSPWSNIIRFETTSDGIAPAMVQNLELNVSGTSFVAEWDAVTLNEDGSEMTDFRDYQISITAGAVTKRYFTIQPRFDLTLDINRGAFGTPQPNITISVKARDLSGNAVIVGATASASNPAPPAPQNTAARPFGDSIHLKWDEVVIDDLKEYQIWQSLDQITWTKIWVGTTTSTFIDTSQYSRHYFKVRVIDQFDQYGEGDVVSAIPLAQFGTDTQGPDQLTGLTLTPGTALTNGSWAYHIDANWNDSLAEDFSQYEYRYSIAGLNEWQYGPPVTDSEVRISGLLPNTQYDVQVRAVDLSRNPSLWAFGSETTLVDTVAPNKPSVPTVAGDTQSFLITHDLKDSNGVLLEDDLAFLRVYSGASGFTPGPTNYLGEISVSPPSISAVAGGKFARPATATSGSTAIVYVKVIAVDRNGNVSVPSDQASVTLNLIANANIADATIGDAKILDLAADKLKANSAFVNNLNIKSKLTVQVGGTIESSNYSSINKTGYQIANNTLTMYDGTIAAKAIELKESSANLVPAGYALFDYNAKWYNPGEGLVIDSSVAATQEVLVAKFGATSLKIVNTGGAITKRVHFAPVIDASGYNIIVEPNTDYILSMYVRAAQVDAAGDFSIGYQGDVTGQVFNGVTTTNGQWTRVHWNFNSGANQKLLLAVKMIKSGTWNIDGVQLEAKVGKLDTPSLFKLPGVTKLSGRSITTGEIASNQLSPNGDTLLPAWSINLQGNAHLNDVWVRGKIIVGGHVYAPGVQAAMAVQSYNYTSGVSGWAIKGDGNVEFVDGTFRGDIIGGTIIGTVYKTSTSGRRIEMGLQGYSGEISFFAPNNEKARIWSWSTDLAADGTTREAIAIGVEEQSGIYNGWGSVIIQDPSYIFGVSSMTSFFVGGNGPETGKGFYISWATDRGSATASPTSQRRFIVSAISNSHFIPSTGVFSVWQHDNTTSRARLHIDAQGDTQFYHKIGNSTFFQETMADYTLQTRFIIGNPTNYIYHRPGGSFIVSEKHLDGTTAPRFWVQGNEIRMYPSTEGIVGASLVVRPATGDGTSPVVSLTTRQFGNGFYYGAGWKYWVNSVTLADPRLEARDHTDAGFASVWAWSFDVQSDIKAKSNIEDYGPGALEKIKAARVRAYDMELPRPGKPDSNGRMLAGPSQGKKRRIGLLAQEAPVETRVGDEENGMAIDIYALTCLGIASVQELAALVQELRDEVDDLKKNPPPK